MPTINLNANQADMVGRFIAHQHRTLQTTVNKHRECHPHISEAAYAYLSETSDLLHQLEMEYLIYPRGMRTRGEDQ